MSEIIPAILEPTLDDITEHLARVRGLAKTVQVDVIDGIFAPAHTWPYAVPAQRDEFERISLQEDAFPLWEDFDFQFDLMLAHPEEDVTQWIALGAAALIVHEPAPGARKAIEDLQGVRGGDYGVSIGIALLPDTSPGSLEPYKGQYDFVQVMGIQVVGAQGAPFEPKSIELVRALRALYPELAIQIDGHVSLNTIGALAEAGANRFAVGSALYKSDDIKERMQALREVAGQSSTL